MCIQIGLNRRPGRAAIRADREQVDVRRATIRKMADHDG